MLTVRYFAAARAAAGTAEEFATAATLAALRAGLVAAHGEKLDSVMSACSFLVDGLAWRDLDRALPAEATVDVLPPFAGG